MEQLLNRFLKYVKINTRSDEKSLTVPSTLRQVEFARSLASELQELGFSEVYYNQANGFVTATVPSNVAHEVETIGFLAHYDTADFESENIRPQVVKNYDGKDIRLNDEYVLSVSDFPNLKNYVGHTLITTDGTTLLGADDKAGLTEIIEAMLYLMAHPEIKHGRIRIAFGPDEEIGRGADLFDVEGFGAEFAYTVDGGPLGDLEYESFNAAQAIVNIKGVSVHPGSAKGKMINALKLAMDYHAMLPDGEVPECTEGYEGYYMCYQLEGNCEQASMTYLVRDHDRQQFEHRKQLLLDNAKQMNRQFDVERVSVELKDQYYNMGEIILKNRKPLDVAKQAMENLGITPVIAAIRGGTDGSKLSFMGLPTPNIFTGGENYHGRYEFASLQVMMQAKMTIVEIARLFAEQ